jgi:hypothetical protein
MLPPIFGTAVEINNRELIKKRLDGESVAGDQLKIMTGGAELSHKIIMSGKLMVNDSLSSYANGILDVLLKDEPVLRKKLHVYFYYSTGTNAITLYNGMIIIELGLMAHIKNEAQLAFILAHEVSHFRENHFLKYYSYAKGSRNSLPEILNYSRDLEEQADSLGYELYKKTTYALSEAIIVFDILRDSDMPEEQIPFSNSFFEHGDYKFPASYSKDSLLPIVDAEYDETKSTHPSYEKRMAKIQSLLESFNSDGNLFIVSEDAFNALRLISREECCSIYLASGDYGNAIYCAYTLLNENNLNLFAKEIIGKGLYELAARKNPTPPVHVPNIFIIAYDQWENFDFGIDSTETIITPHNKIAGESQKLHYFFEQMNGPEVTMLSLNWNWQLYREKNYKDSLLSLMCDNLFEMLSGTYYIKLSDYNISDSLYLKQPPDSQTEIPDSADFPIVLYPEYMLHAVDEFMSDSAFLMRLRTHLPGIHPPSTYPKNIYFMSNYDRENDPGAGVENICILPPAYYKLKETYAPGTFYYRYDAKASEECQVLQQNSMISAARNIKGHYFLLTPENLSGSSVDKYSTYCLATQWLDETLMNLSNGYSLSPAYTTNSDSLIKTLGTRYLMHSAIISETNTNGGPKKTSKMETFVFDLQTGKLILYYEDIIESHANAQKMYIYYTRVFKKITAKP